MMTASVDTVARSLPRETSLVRAFVWTRRVFVDMLVVRRSMPKETVRWLTRSADKRQCSSMSSVDADRTRCSMANRDDQRCSLFDRSTNAFIVSKAL
jgi:hypothetical protein